VKWKQSDRNNCTTLSHAGKSHARRLTNDHTSIWRWKIAYGRFPAMLLAITRIPDVAAKTITSLTLRRSTVLLDRSSCSSVWKPHSTTAVNHVGFHGSQSRCKRPNRPLVRCLVYLGSKLKVLDDSFILPPGEESLDCSTCPGSVPADKSISNLQPERIRPRIASCDKRSHPSLWEYRKQYRQPSRYR